jgi:hypothetical protein
VKLRPFFTFPLAGGFQTISGESRLLRNQTTQNRYTV